MEHGNTQRNRSHELDRKQGAHMENIGGGKEQEMIKLYFSFKRSKIKTKINTLYIPSEF